MQLNLNNIFNFLFSTKTTKLKIKVATYMYGNFDYFRLSERINRLYCSRHGYEYVIDRSEPLQDRHINIQKVRARLNVLNNCDYLLFIDADACFYSHELSIEEEILDLLSNKKILFAANCGCEKTRWTPSLPNSGIILMKNDPEVIQFHEDWWNYYEVHPEKKFIHPYEQQALWNELCKKYENIISLCQDYYRMNGIYGQYIRHFISVPYKSDQARFNEMAKICKRLGLATS
jgi:hypothetical protein